MRCVQPELRALALLVAVVLGLGACGDADEAVGERRNRTGAVPTTLVITVPTTSCPTVLAMSDASVERYLAALALFDAEAATLDADAAALSRAWDDRSTGSDGRLEALTALVEDAQGFLARFEGTTAPPGLEQHHANMSGTATRMVESIEAMARATRPGDDGARREALRSLELRTAIFGSMTAAAQDLAAEPLPSADSGSAC